MRTSTVFPALLSLLSFASPTLARSTTAKTATFTPAQVFKNVNLNHIISLERNYAKESINVIIENIDKQPQDAYYLPFTADQMSRVGGIEVKDRKDPKAGPFTVEAAEIDPNSDLQYYKISLPEPLKAGAQQTIGISYYYLSAYNPLPAEIAQDDNQFLVYSFSAYAPSAYATSKQKTEVKAANGNIPDFTELPNKLTQKAGNKITYGPFDDKPAGALEPVEIRFEFTKPVNHVAELERDIEVSHWGGNVAFEERYTLYNRGANLSTLFNRVKYAQSAYYKPNTYALKELKFPLRAGSVDAYYTDVIGNISTSRFRQGNREAVLEIKPRYPVFGGWKFPFTIGWNSDAKNYVRKVSGNSHVLKVPFLEGPQQAEGVEYQQIRVQILLPEGADNVKVFTSIPESSITENSVGLVKTYLDTVGRTSVTLKARNLVDDFRGRDIIITYDYSFASSVRKPVMIFASFIAVVLAAWAVGQVDLKFK